MTRVVEHLFSAVPLLLRDNNKNMMRGDDIGPRKRPRLSCGATTRTPQNVTFALELETVFIIPANDEVDFNDGEDTENGNAAISNDDGTDTRRTCDVTVLSSQHGRARRELREITRFDLQAAVKYGVKKRAHNCRRTGQPRWQYTFGNIVYITDESSKKEITSFREPIHIQPATITNKMLDNHREDRQTLREEPLICVTHSIVVIDQSGSMKTSDVTGFRNRSQAAYGILALEYIAEQLHQRGDGKSLDAVSVIEMNDEATVVYDREPLDWILFNKVLDRQKTAVPRSHGNYNSALQAAKQLIYNEILSFEDADPGERPSYAIIFLSDGRPSDGKPHENDLRNHILADIAGNLGSKLSLHTIGLGNSNEDFSTLRQMSSWLNGLFDSKATFAQSRLSTAQLGAAFSSISTSMTATRTEALSSAPRVKKVVQLRSKSVPQAQRKFQVYDRSVSRWRYDHEEDSWPWTGLPFKNNTASGFDMEIEPFGMGAERLAYMFHEIDASHKRLGKPMVAKESIAIDDEERKVDFHENFCRVQYKASLLAKEFNKVVARAPSLSPVDSSMRVPLVEFLKCNVYEYTADDGMKCGLLVEDFLKGKFTKFNSNNGYVRNNKGERKIELIGGEVYMADFLQAFSHWTHSSTSATFLVCDLQGVLNLEGRRPKFMLTDPCICSKRKHGERKFGRSDMGPKGFHVFRKNHVCNEVCKGLGLPAFGSRYSTSS